MFTIRIAGKRVTMLPRRTRLAKYGSVGKARQRGQWNSVN